jgi:UDP-N-acetylmuramate dehydrogenase
MSALSSMMPPKIRGQILDHELMKHHTTWKLGGAADRVFIPQDYEDLLAGLEQLSEDEPLMVLGAGSNVLVREGGIRGTVIILQPGLQAIRYIPDTQLVQVEAGITLARLVSKMHELGLTGLEFLGGIPGTLGGALKMNAGAYGEWIWQSIQSVALINRKGEVQEYDASAFKVDYREIVMPAQGWFVQATFKLERGEIDMARRKLLKLNRQRVERQPLEWPSCGSVFRNPPDDFAWRLIEAAGLKGLRIGDIMVSEKHANFMINLGKGRSSDAEALIETVQKEVEDRFGITLQREVLIVGEPETDKVETV